jgi:hypothetical protein
MVFRVRATPPTSKTLQELTVATPNTKTTSDIKTGRTIEPPTEMLALADRFREQLVSSVRQSHQLSLDGAQTWVKAMSVFPMMDLPNLPGIPALPGMEASTMYLFDMASDLLNAQRAFALQLAGALVPEKTR